MADDTYDELTDPDLVISGTQDPDTYDFFNLADGYQIDARTAIFPAQTVPTPTPPGYVVDYPFDMRTNSASNSYYAAGGIVNFSNSLDLTWAQSKSVNSAAVMAMGGNPTMDGWRIHNCHDATRIFDRDTAVGSWSVKNCWATYCRDDFIENDQFLPGTIDDCLIDGCWVFYSSRNLTGDGSSNTVTITNCLIRMQDLPGPFNENDLPPEVTEGFGNCFKLQAESPKLVVNNCTFWFPNYACHPSLGPDRDFSVDAIGMGGSKLTSGDGNVIVYTGPSTYPGDLTNCTNTTITTDVSVWNSARDAWITGHPLVPRIDGLDVEPPTAENIASPRAAFIAQQPAPLYW